MSEQRQQLRCSPLELSDGPMACFVGMQNVLEIVGRIDCFVCHPSELLLEVPGGVNVKRGTSNDDGAPGAHDGAPGAHDGAPGGHDGAPCAHDGAPGAPASANAPLADAL